MTTERWGESFPGTYTVPFYSNTEPMLCCALSRLKLL